MAIADTGTEQQRIGSASGVGRFLPYTETYQGNITVITVPPKA